MKQLITKYKCDGCLKDITRKRHMVIALSHLSGFFNPPFTALYPDEQLFRGRPDIRLCSFACAGPALERLHSDCKKEDSRLLDFKIDQMVYNIPIKRHA